MEKVNSLSHSRYDCNYTAGCHLMWAVIRLAKVMFLLSVLVSLILRTTIELSGWHGFLCQSA